MTAKEKYILLDKVLLILSKSNISSVPECIDGFGKFPDVTSELHSKYRIVESELRRFKLVEIAEGGDNSTTSGYYYFRLSATGLEFILNKKSTKELYEAEELSKQKKERLEELSLDQLEFQKTIREQEQRIRNLTEELKFLSLLQRYWWVILVSSGLGISVGKWLF